jgi:hypothetical protein
VRGGTSDVKLGAEGSVRTKAVNLHSPGAIIFLVVQFSGHLVKTFDEMLFRNAGATFRLLL